MADVNIYSNLAVNKQSILNAKYYPLSTAARTALTLAAGDVGLGVFDTTLLRMMYWSGSAWGDASPPVASSVIYRGALAASAAAPSSPAVGDTYFFNSAGTTPGTWTPTAVVEIGDQVIWDGTAWNYFQGNIVSASLSTEGKIQLASQAEVDAGSITNKAVTPATLTNTVPGSALTLRQVRRFVFNITSLVLNTPTAVTHNLALANMADLVVTCWQGGALILLTVEPVSTSAINVTSNVTLANVRVVCEG